MKINLKTANLDSLFKYDKWLAEKEETLLKNAKVAGELSEADDQRLTKIRDRRKATLDAIENKKRLENASRTSDLNSRSEALRNTHLQGARGLEGDNTSGSTATHDPVGRVHDNFQSDPRKGFVSPREFMTLVMNAGRSNRPSDDPRMRFLHQNMRNAVGADEHSTFSDPHGGYLVPEGFSIDPLMLGPEPASVSIGGSAPTFLSPQTRKVSLDRTNIKFNARVDKDHSTSVSGGLVVTRRAEAAARSASRMEFEQVEMQANSLWGFAFATEEILMDSPVAFASLIASSFGDEFRAEIINERLNGTGVGEYLGVLSSANAARIQVDRTTDDTILGEDVLAMRSRCWGYENAVWMAHPDALPTLAQLHIESTNDAGVLTFYHQSFREDVPDMILGRPLILTEYMPSYTKAGGLSLINWNEYLEGVYMPLDSGESIHVRFETGERCFRFWMRNDGRPWWKSVLTPKNSNNSFTMSPFIMLNDDTPST